MGASDDKILETFRQRFRYDRGLGRLKSVADYQRMFRGFDEAIAAEHARLEAESAAAVDAKRTPRPAEPATPARPSAASPQAPPPAARGPAPKEDVRRIGTYRVVRELGRGGMGVVLLAEDERLGRLVALKVIAPVFAESAEARGRFRREAEAAARLDHPGICTVYETGEHDGVPFLAMRFVEGRTVAALLAEGGEKGAPPGDLALTTTTSADASPTRSSSTTRRAAVTATVHLVEKVARALHVAHESGVIHRDVKPANVMVRPDGEPVILDFGLARPEALAESGLTAPGSLVGTPAYLSPEQLLGRAGPADRRCDVYSLGVVLYECVAGELPFAAPTLNALFQQIMTTEPPDPRTRNPSVSNDLAVVIATAMEKDRSRRYGSALDFAEDLRRVRMHEPILARPAGPWTRVRRWSQRRPALSAALLLLFATLVVGLGTAIRLWRRADSFRVTAEERKDEAVRAAADLRTKNAELVLAERRAREAHEAARAEALVAASEAESESPTLSLLLAAEAAKIPGALERPTVLRRLSSAVHAVTERAVLRRPGLAVTASAFAPTGDRFAVGYADGAVRVHDAEGAERLRLAGHQDVVSAVSFFPAGDRLVTASWDGTARVWGADGRELARISCDGGRVLAARISPDGAFVATGHEDGGARLWRSDGTPAATLAGGSFAYLVRFSPDGARVAVCGTDRVVRVFDLAGKLLREHGGHAKRITAAEFLADGRLATASMDGTTIFWDAASDAKSLFDAGGVVFDIAVSGGRVAVAGEDGVRLLDASGGGPPRETASAERGRQVRRAAFLPGGDELVLGDESGAVRRWTIGGAASVPLCGHLATVSGLCLSPRGDALLSTGLDETARLTDLRGPGRAVVGAAKAGCVWTACCSPTRDEFAVGCDDGTVRVLDFDGAELAVLRGHGGPVVCVRYAPDGERIASGSADTTARVWTRDGRPLATLAGHGGSVVHLEWSPDGGRILTAGDVPGNEPRTEGEAFPRRPCDSDAVGARLWTADGKPLAWVERTELVNCVAFFPEGGRFVVGTGEPLICASDGHVVAKLPHHEGRLGAVAISPDGERIATSGPDLKVRVSDVGGRMVREVRGNWNFVGALDWAPTGRRLLATGPGAVRASVWDEDGRMLVSLGPFEQLVGQAEFSRDGRRIAAASFDGTARVWDEGGEELAVLRGHADAVLAARFSRDARNVVTLSADGTARTWAVTGDGLVALAARRAKRAFLPDEQARYAEILGLDPQVERAAKRLADSTLARLPLPEDAAESLRADASLAPALRERALAVLAESRIDPDVLASVAWFDVRYAGRTDADYGRGLRWLEAARRVSTSIWRMSLYRGTALYRVGRLDEARRELERNIATAESTGETNHWAEWFYLGMIAGRTGDAPCLERQVVELRRLMSDPGSRPDDADPTLQEFVRVTGVVFPPATQAAPPR